MSQEQQTIKWGDIIRIHGVSTIPEKGFKGLIISKGFTDPNIYYQTYQQYKDVNFYRESLFQIMPKSNFDLHDQLLFDQNIKEEQRDALKERAEEEVRQLISNLENKYTDKEHPDEVNVTFGSEVVFRHVESGQYLCGVYKAADIREGAFKLQLTKDLSSQIIFKVISHRSYQQEGNKIYYDDCLRIYHIRSDCYMNFPYADDIKEIAIILDQNYEPATFEKHENGFELFNNRPNIKKPKKPKKQEPAGEIQELKASEEKQVSKQHKKLCENKRINVINENKPKCLWKFIQHCRYQDSLKKQKIKSHDIVYFQHTKNKGLIATTLAQKKYYLKQIKVSTQETVSYECFWELIPINGNELGPEKCNQFWARNIVTGQQLQIGDINVQIKSKDDIKQGGFNSGGLVNLVYYVEEGGSKTQWLLQRGEKVHQNQDAIPVIKYFDSNIEKIDFKSVTALTEDSFIIVRVSQETIRDVSYILSSQQAFVKVVQILSTELKRMQTKRLPWKDMFLKLNEDLLQSFISVLKLLTGKIYGTDYDNIESSGSSPIRQIQKILVQTGIAQLLIQIIFTLYDPFIQISGNHDITDDKSIRMKVADIFKLSYVLVQKIVKDFIDNKIYFSRWIYLFLEHSNQINQPFIQQTLISILENNPVSIKEMIKPETIDRLIQSFFKQVQESEEMPTKHLRLFSTFIRGQDIIFKENQKYILNKFFIYEHNPSNGPQLQYTFKFKVEYRVSQVEEVADDIISKERNKVVKISIGNIDSYTIKEFYDTYPKKFNYLLSYINLLADVCMDRNNEAIEYVQTHLPLAVVSSVLFDPQIASLNKELKEKNLQGQTKKYQISNIHEPFIRIGHHAYVNNFKFSPIQRIRKIVKWYKYQDGEVNQVEQITKTKRVYEGEKEEQEKTYLKYLLIYIKKFLETCDRQVSNLEILYTVLNFLKETILLGLWESINQFREIIPQLIKNIIKIEANVFFEVEEWKDTGANRYTGKEWVDRNKQKLKMNKPEIALAIQCKIKANQIFKYINEMQNDIRLRYMMSFFQGIYEATQNVENYSQAIQDQVNEQALASLQSQQQQQIKTRNQKARQEFYKIFGTNILGEVKKYSQDEDMLMKNYLWYNKIRTMIPLKQVDQSQDPDKDRDLFKNAQDFTPDKIVLSLFELSGYYNKNLLNSSLNMLRGMFQQRSDIIQSYKNLLICGKGNLSEVYSNLKFMRNKFAMLKNDIIIKYDGNANKSFAYAIFKPYDHLGRQQDKRSGIIQDLFFLARTLKDNVSLKNIESLMYVDKEVFNKEIIYQFYNERQKNNYLFQQLNMAQGIYGPLIEYIKIIGDQQLPEIHRLLLFSIYQYLTLLCFNNMKAKHLFMKYIPDILPHLKKRVGAASFLYQVCINNKILVNDEELVNLIFQKALGSCVQLQSQELLHGMVSHTLRQDHLINNGFQKSRIMYSMRSLLLFNDEGHKRNQQILLNKLSDNRFRVLTFAGQTKFTAKKEEFNLNPQITYITARFQLFSLLVESQNLINIGKLQNMHSYEYFLDRLIETNRWQLRRALRSYLNRLYYVHQDNNSFMFERFVKSEFKIINGQLIDLIELHRSKMLTEELKVKNGIRFCYAQSQITLLIIQILITLHQMLLKPKFITILLRQLNKEQRLDETKRSLHIAIVKLLKNLGCIAKLYKQTKTIVSFIKQIVQLMRKNIFVNFQVRFLQKMAEPNDKSLKQSDEKGENGGQKGDSKKIVTFDRSKSFFRNLVEMIRHQKQEESRQKFKDQYLKNKNQMDATESDLKNRYVQAIFLVPEETLRPINSAKVKETQEEHYQQHLQTANSKMFKLLAKPEFEENQQNLELNNRLNSVKQLLSDSPVLKKLKQDEFYKLVGIFTNMDNISSQIYTANWDTVGNQDPKPVFSRKEIITNCFSLIIDYPDMIRDEQKIFIIKLVRCYIAEAVEEKQNHKLSVDKWNADYYSDETSGEDILSENRSQLVKRQHQIQQCKGSKLLLSIFKENLYSKHELLNQALLLGIVYLYNGNTYCQNSILKELVADISNSAFVSIKNLIRNIGNFLIEVRKFKQNEKKRDFSYKIVDSYDHFDKKQNILVKLFGHKTDKFEIQTELNYELALCRAFRFLQLFCQNNNIEMKKFVMSQTNQNGQSKVTSINFISEATQLLRQFFKIMSIKIVNIPPSILDFINQITQIPCVVCQKAFMKSTFFQDMSYMAGFFEQKVNIEQRKFNFFLDHEKNSEESEEDPLSILQQIYQKGIGLALSNFQGNDDQIFSQFLNKCQPRYLWIVIRQSMIKLLRPKAHQFKVYRQEIQKKLQEEYLTSPVKGKKEDWIQFKQFLIQKAFLKEIFYRFEDRPIAKFLVQQRAKGKEFQQPICDIIDVLIILKKIDDFADKKKKAATANLEAPDLKESQKAVKAKQFRQDMYVVAQPEYKHIKKFVQTFQDLILSIEVSSDNGEVVSFQNVYFPRHPVFSYLAADTRDTIMFNVSRATRRDKLIQLQDYFPELDQQIKWNYQLKYYKGRFLGFPYNLSITSQYIEQIRKAARFISYLICFLMLMLIVVEHDTKIKESYFIFFHYNEKLIMRAICLIQLILTLLFSVLWIKMRLKLCLSKLKKRESEEGGESGEPQEAQEGQGQATEQADGPPASPTGLIPKVIFYAVLIEKNFFKLIDSIKNVGKKIKKLLYDDLMGVFGFRHISLVFHFCLDPIFNFLKSIYVGFMALLEFQPGFLSILIFVIASIMGNFVGVEWYVIHLFDYFVGIPLLTNVFKAVINNIGQLTLLSTFAGCFILVFNIISLNTYTVVIYQDDIPAQSCVSIIGCVLQVYTSGAIGDDMDQIYPGRFTYDTVYNIFMEIIFANMISGIMIDSFGSLKEADAERDNDKKNNCYICSMQKPEMEKQGTTFKKHTEKHFLWNYLFYRYVVQKKDACDYTGLEYSISTQIGESKIDWFPDNGPKDEGGAVQQLMGQIKSQMEKIMEEIEPFMSNQTTEVGSSRSAIQAKIDENNKKPEIEGGQVLALQNEA